PLPRERRRLAPPYAQRLGATGADLTPGARSAGGPAAGGGRAAGWSGGRRGAGMSTILKALRRLGQGEGKTDRPLGQPIRSAQADDEGPAGPARRRWPVFAAAIGAGAAAGLFLLFFSGGKEPRPPGETAAAAGVRTAPGNPGPNPTAPTVPAASALRRAP